MSPAVSAFPDECFRISLVRPLFSRRHDNDTRSCQKRRASDIEHCRAGTAGVKRRGLIVVHGELIYGIFIEGRVKKQKVFFHTPLLSVFVSDLISILTGLSLNISVKFC